MHKNLEEINKNQLLEVLAQLSQDTAVNGMTTEAAESGRAETAYAHNI